MLYHWNLHPRERNDPDKDGTLSTEVFGHNLRNAIGTSAGIDKHVGGFGFSYRITYLNQGAATRLR